MVFRIDTHVHTSETSKCGRSSAAEMVAAYKAAGVDAIVISDHFVNGNSLCAFYSFGMVVRYPCNGFCQCFGFFNISCDFTASSDPHCSTITKAVIRLCLMFHDPIIEITTITAIRIVLSDVLHVFSCQF